MPVIAITRVDIFHLEERQPFFLIGDVELNPKSKKAPLKELLHLESTKRLQTFHTNPMNMMSL